MKIGLETGTRPDWDLMSDDEKREWEKGVPEELSEIMGNPPERKLSPDAIHALNKRADVQQVSQMKAELREAERMKHQDNLAEALDRGVDELGESLAKTEMMEAEKALGKSFEQLHDLSERLGLKEWERTFKSLEKTITATKAEDLTKAADGFLLAYGLSAERKFNDVVRSTATETKPIVAEGTEGRTVPIDEVIDPLMTEVYTQLSKLKAARLAAKAA